MRRRLEAFLDHALVEEEYPVSEEAAPGSWSPAVDLVETGGGYVLSAELPGIERSDIDLEVDGRRVVLSGRRPAPGGTPAGAAPPAFRRMERSHGPFRRVFELDKDVDSQRVEAKLARGVLVVRFPKVEEGVRQVVVDDAGPGGGDRS